MTTLIGRLRTSRAGDLTSQDLDEIDEWSSGDKHRLNGEAQSSLKACIRR
jgi:hypothetical protein